MKPDSQESGSRNQHHAGSQSLPNVHDPRLGLAYGLATIQAISSNGQPVSAVYSSHPDHEIGSFDWLANLPPLNQQALFGPSQLSVHGDLSLQSHQPQRHHHQYNHRHIHPDPQQYGDGMESGQLGANNPRTGQASCVSSISCPRASSTVPGADGWNLQHCADLRCVPDVPDVEQCMPPSNAQSPSQSSADAFPLPVPIDFTSTTSSPSPSTQQNFGTASPVSNVLAVQADIRPALTRKRRSSTTPLADPKPATTTKAKTPRPTKVAHSVVEQRYRDNLNGKIAQLHKTLSTTRGSGSSSSDEGEGEGVLPRTRKADVLASAIDYIKRAEKGRANLENEVDFLKTRITMLEKLVKCEDCNILTQMNQMRLQAGFAM